MLSTGCTDTKMERLNWIVLESSADLRQNLQSSASDNKPGIIQHFLVWLRALRGRYVGISPPLASAEVCRHQASQRIRCMRNKPPQLLPIYCSFDQISVMMIDSTCFTHRRVPHPRMIHFYTETRPLRARYSNDKEEEERQCQS